MNVLKSFFKLFYPDLCCGCGNNLLGGEKNICLACLSKIAKTDYHTFTDNPVAKLFYGKIDIFNAMAMCFYDKSGLIQHLIHQLKYKNNSDIGVLLGRMLGSVLSKSKLYSGIDAIIPIPLHAKKERKRGYNQSFIIAQGVVQTYKIPIINNVLTRVEYTESQTRKSRWDRYKNVKDMFAVLQPEKIAGKHVLLIDDVITTGATIEACAKHLLAIDGVRVSIAGIATSAR